MLGRLLILTIVAGLLPLGATFWWPLELSTHFRLQYLVVAVAVLIGALACRRRHLAALLAVCVALNAWPLWPYIPGAGTSAARAPSSGDPVAVLNLNANAGNPAHERILAVIRGAGADVVTLIELSPGLDRRLDALADLYPHRFTLPAAGNFGLGVLSRYPLSAAEAFELGATPAIAGRIALPGGILDLVAVHLVPPTDGTRAAERNRQLRLLAERARGSDSEVLLVCGDFNLSPYSPYFRRFETDAGLRDLTRGDGLRISWPTSLPVLGIPIDHCFGRGRLEAETVETMDRTGSDHYPVRHTFRWLESQ